MKRAILFLLLFPLVASFISCGNKARFDAGNPLTAEELTALQAQLGEQENNQESNQENDKTPTSGMVFWLQNGSVYHVRSTCHHISEKPNVMSGTVEQAQAAGKSRACSSCG